MPRNLKDVLNGLSSEQLERIAKKVEVLGKHSDIYAMWGEIEYLAEYAKSDIYLTPDKLSCIINSLRVLTNDLEVAYNDLSNS